MTVNFLCHSFHPLKVQCIEEKDQRFARGKKISETKLACENPFPRRLLSSFEGQQVRILPSSFSVMFFFKKTDHAKAAISEIKLRLIELHLLYHFILQLLHSSNGNEKNASERRRVLKMVGFSLKGQGKCEKITYKIKSILVDAEGTPSSIKINLHFLL